MNKDEKNKTNFNNSILEDLKSSDKTRVNNAVKKLSNKADASIIKALLDLYSTLKEDSYVKKQLKDVFSQLKISKAVPVLIEGLSHQDDKIKELCLFSLWSSSLDAADYLPPIVQCACKGDYMVALEALTLVENLEGPFSEQDLIESMIFINEYLSEGGDDKVDLIKSILDTIKVYEQQIQI